MNAFSSTVKGTTAILAKPSLRNRCSPLSGFAGLLLCAVLSFAVAPTLEATETAPGGWAAIFVNSKIGGQDSPWLFYADAQYRYFDVGNGLYEYLLRPAVGFAVNDSLRVWLGYARFRNESDPVLVSDENRYWQQIDWSGTEYLGGQLSLRARTEQRDVTFSEDLRQVLRLMARYQRPMDSRFASDWFVSVEPFFDLNTTDWGGGTGLSQNRLFLGLGFTLQPRLRLEAGLMQQYFWLDNKENLENHLGMINLKWRF